MGPKHRLNAWMVKDTTVCNQSLWLESLLWMNRKRRKKAWFLPSFPLWSWSVCLIFFRRCHTKHTWQTLSTKNKSYTFHVTYAINWLLLPLTQIIVGVYNAKKRNEKENQHKTDNLFYISDKRKRKKNWVKKIREKHIF